MDLFCNKDIKKITYSEITDLIYEEMINCLSYHNLNITQDKVLDTYFSLEKPVFDYIKSKYRNNSSGFSSISERVEITTSRQNPAVSFPFGRGGIGRGGRESVTRTGNGWQSVGIAHESPDLLTFKRAMSGNRLSRGTRAKSLIPQVGVYIGEGAYLTNMDQFRIRHLRLVRRVFEWDITNFRGHWQHTPELQALASKSGVYIWEVVDAFPEGCGVYIGKALNFRERTSNEWNDLFRTREDRSAANTPGVTCSNDLCLGLYRLLNHPNEIAHTAQPHTQPPRRILRLHLITSPILQNDGPLCEALESLVIDSIIYNKPHLVDGKLHNPFWRPGLQGQRPTTTVAFIANKAKNPAFRPQGMRTAWFNNDTILNCQQWSRTHSNVKISTVQGRHTIQELIQANVPYNGFHHITNDRFASEVLERVLEKP